jgi:hypothetical protein
MRIDMKVLEANLAFRKRDDIALSAFTASVVPQKRIKSKDSEIGTIQLVDTISHLLQIWSRVAADDQHIFEIDEISGERLADGVELTDDLLVSQPDRVFPRVNLG